MLSVLVINEKTIVFLYSLFAFISINFSFYNKLSTIFNDLTYNCLLKYIQQNLSFIFFISLNDR
ncbi:hypothetical protein B5G13_16295 [Butyricimonas sp. An62]|nr:hypothetical protein B5G13_16295 [Butyricimonas sp. An62]